MFETISARLSRTLGNLRPGARLTESNISDALSDVRRALLEADVALPVVRAFLERVRERALGEEVLRSLTPGQAFVGAVHDELVQLMTAEHPDLNLNVPPPAPLLVAGLQGSGKTTTCAKLARWLAERHGKKSLLVSCDVYRPAAIEQLRVLAGEVDAPFFETDERDPVAIARASLDEARRRMVDFVIIDTAGRLHVDEEMMTEAGALHAAVSPVETLFVADAMTGQDAVNVARAFGETLPLTGVVLTKADGDARGGAALSVRWVTGKPIKFLGTSEKLDGLEAFHAERIASRILGMGDILTLIEEAERKVDREEVDRLARKFQSGGRFNLEDLREQLRQMNQLGGVRKLVEHLPGLGDMADSAVESAEQKGLSRAGAVIDSMTPHERRHPQVIRGSRKRRIAAGSGTTLQDVNRVLKMGEQMQKMMRRMRNPGKMAQMMGALGGEGGGLPGMPGLPGLPGMGGGGGGLPGLGAMGGGALPSMPKPGRRSKSRGGKKRRSR